MLCTSPVGPFFVCHGVRGPGGGVIGEPTFFKAVIFPMWFLISPFVSCVFACCASPRWSLVFARRLEGAFAQEHRLAPASASK